MDTETLMRKYTILSAAWDECSQVWLGIEQNGNVHKFSRKNFGVKSNGQNVDDRFMGGHDKMINKVGAPGSRERVLALSAQYAKMSEVEQSPFEGE